MFIILLALITSIAIPCSEGRQLKLVREHELGQVKKEPGVRNHATQVTAIKKSLGSQKGDPYVTGHNKYSPQSNPIQDHEFSNSKISQTAASRPKTPGNSPGLGHELKEQSFTYVAGETYAVHRTRPGHSPGIGHSFGNMKREPET